MYQHHIDSIEKLKEYFSGSDYVIAIVLDGSIVKGNERVDSDIDAIIVVTDEKYTELAKENRLAETVTGYCTYEAGYFDLKYKTKDILRRAASHASEPTRNAYRKAQVVYSTDPEIEGLVRQIEAYPVHEKADKIACFLSNLQLNRGYFMHVTSADNAYMRAHLAQEIVYSVYRLILIENEMLFPCNRRLEETVRECRKRPENIIELGAKFLSDINEANSEAFVRAFLSETELDLASAGKNVLSQYVKYYEDWWLEENPPFPNEW